MVDLVFVLGFFLLFHFVFYGVWSKSFFKKNWLLNYPILYWLNSHFLILSRNFCIRISWTWYTKSYNLFRNKDVIFLLLEIFFLCCFLQRNCQWSVFSQVCFLRVHTPRGLADFMVNCFCIFEYLLKWL